MSQCPFCNDLLSAFDVSHVCSSGKYAPVKPIPDAKQCDWGAVSTHLHTQANDAAKYQFVLRLCAHISGCTVEQVDAQIVKVMSEQKWEDV